MTIGKVIWIWGASAAMVAVSVGNCHAAEPPPNKDDFMSMSLEQLTQVQVDKVYGASKREQKVTEAPSSVSLVTSTEIKEHGYRNLAEILRSVRGLYVSYDRNYGYVGVRGFNRPGDFGGRILLLVDGHRLNESIYDSAFNLQDFLVDVDLIDRVEVIRGPGSSLYGNNAFFGVVNVVTRRGHDVGGVETSGSYGTFDTFTGRLTYGNRFTNGLEVMVSGSYFQSTGDKKLHYPEFDQPGNNQGIARKRDGENAPSFFGTVAYGDFSLQGGYVKRDKDVPTAAFGTLFNDPHLRTVDTRGYASLQYDRGFADDLHLTSRLYYDYFRYDADYPYEGASPGGPPLINRDIGIAQWWGLDVQASRPFFSWNLATLGAEVRNDFQILQENADINPPARYAYSQVDTINYGVFFQDEISLLTNLVVNLGVRYDNFSTFGDTVNPRAAVIFSPWRETTFKFLYGEAFRAPNGNEFYLSTPFQKANPRLGPEAIRSFEVAYEQYLPHDLRFGISAFHNQTRDLITQLTDPNDGLLYYDNLDQAETWGAEAEVNARFGGGFVAQASYTVQRTVDVKTDRELSNSPRHLVKAGLTAPLFKDYLFGSVDLQYSSSALTLQGRTANDYWLVNANLFSQKLARGLELSAGVYNLFDQRYGYPGAGEHVQDVIRQDGRTFRVKFTYRF